MGGELLVNMTIKDVQDIAKANGERFQNLSYNLGTYNGKMQEIISYSQLVDHLKATVNEENETNDDLYMLRAPNGVILIKIDL